MTLRQHLSTLLICLSVSLGSVANAQSTPISIMVGFPPGGASDTLARLMADQLRQELNTTVIVENRPSMGGRLAAVATKNAKPDGKTLLITPNSTGVFETLNLGAAAIGYDVLQDLQPIARLTASPMVLVTGPQTGARSTQDLINWLRQNPSLASFGTAGFGGDSTFYGLQLAKMAGIDMTNVPYRGNAPLIVDMLGGQIAAGVMVAADAAPHIRAGKLVPLGVFTQERTPLLPEIPTLKEQGFDTGADNGWMGLWTTAGTPPATIAALEAATKKILANPDTQAALQERLFQRPDFRPSTQVNQDLRQEMATWGPIIKASGITLTP